MTRLPSKADDIGDGITGTPEDENQENGNLSVLPLWQVERKAIEDAIEQCDGNILKAAELLDINPSTIHRKRKKWQSLS